MRTIQDPTLSRGEHLYNKTFKKVTFDNAALWSYFYNCDFIECKFVNYTDIERLKGGVFKGCKFINCTFNDKEMEFRFYHHFLEDTTNDGNSVTKESFGGK